MAIVSDSFRSGGKFPVWRLAGEIAAIFVLIHLLAVVVVSWAMLALSLPTQWPMAPRLALLVVALIVAGAWPVWRSRLADRLAEMTDVGEPVARFLVECVEVSADPTSKAPRTRKRVMFDAFERWCIANGVTPLSARCFGRALRDRGVRSIHSNGAFWIGLTLTSAWVLGNEADQ